ncbi:hypothetical protein [Vibrio sonorensis]|uniref:hypothetical protein n=1 Tax=Vibrio sonorensis TaxID=1004316 RepID=UPI0008D9A0AD|nr:hypothetical protein [Vibrio sonorensis]
MNNIKLSALCAAISLPLLTACVTPGEDDPNALTKQGAAGGALLGLTLGALTGEPELAVKGAIAGGVTGGVAGAGADIQNNRENIRDDNRNDALSKIGNSSHNQTALSNWSELDNFVGEWNVNIQNHGSHESQLNELSAVGSLAKTTQADVAITNQHGIDLTAQFSFTPEKGYQLAVANNAKQVDVNFAGEFNANSNRYNFYPTNINDVIYQDIATADTRLELSFAGQQVWTLTSYAFLDGQEQPLQSFRFTRI